MVSRPNNQVQQVQVVLALSDIGSSGDTYTPISSTNSIINDVHSLWNFGNGYFGTTAVASAGSNGNGAIFEYDVPTGYYALNTKNINTYG
jgi:hypothetical protein